MEKVRFEDLTSREVGIAEKKAGISIASLEDPNFPKVDLLIALGWVGAKRSNPTLTFEAYGDSKTLNEVMDDLGFNDDEEGED